MGTRRFSIAQYDYLDDGTRASEQEILDAFSLRSDSIQNFYQEASYGALDFSISLLISDITDLAPTSCTPSTSNVLVEVDEHVEPDPFWPDIDHHLALVHNNCTQNFSTFGNLTGFPTLSHGTVYLPLARVTSEAFSVSDFAGLSNSTWAHEVGHGLGVPFHAQAYKCGSSPLSAIPSECINVAVGHQHDIMGSRHAGTHFNGHFKDYLGWLEDENKLAVDGGADACILTDLFDLAQAADTGNVQFIDLDLDVPIPAETAGGTPIDFDRMSLEFRGHTGFDARPFKQVPLDAGGFRNVTAEVNAFGALIQMLNCDDQAEPWHPCIVYELDMQPASMDDTNLPDFWDFIDGYLLEGESWDVPLNNIQVSVVDTSSAPQSIRVAVRVGNPPDATWYLDSDGDGFGDPNMPLLASCPPPPGYLGNAGDCDDTDASSYSGAPEVNDGLDNQCAGDPGFGVIDETSGLSGFNDPDDKTRFSWPSQQGATAYEVLRSGHADFSADCVSTQVTDSSWIDTEIPLIGEGFYYLNRPVSPFLGSFGQDSSLVERTNLCP